MDNAYRYAFNHYLRKGTPIERTLQTLLTKADHPTAHYIWRTKRDSKVRSAHAANNGKIFAWDSSPETGHPGEDYGCRCTSEPVTFAANQTLITAIKDNPEKWGNHNFLIYYLLGNGKTVTLSHIGYLQVIVDYYSNTLGAYERLKLQIINAGLISPTSNFTYSFNKSYDFGGVFSGVKFSFGEAVVKGQFEGHFTVQKESIAIEGIISYKFSDKFSDPTSKVEMLMEEENITREQALARLNGDMDDYGTPYRIIGEWQKKFNAIIKPE